MVKYKLNKDDNGVWVVCSLDGTLYRRLAPTTDYVADRFFRTEDGNYRIDGKDMPNNYQLYKQGIIKTWNEYKEANKELEEAKRNFLQNDYRMASELPHLFIAV
jgi:hypothetical protein